MSRENVELVLAFYDRFAETGEIALDLLSDDFEFDVSDVVPDAAGPQRVGAAESMHRSYAGMFDDYRVTLEKVLAAQDDRVVTEVRDGGRMKGSTAQVRNRFFHVFTVRQGRIARWSSHTSRERALSAARV